MKQPIVLIAIGLILVGLALCLFTVYFASHPDCPSGWELQGVETDEGGHSAAFYICKSTGETYWRGL
jgi:hypothetical protein